MMKAPCLGPSTSETLVWTASSPLIDGDCFTVMCERGLVTSADRPPEGTGMSDL